jgi:hypothetical protein
MNGPINPLLLQILQQQMGGQEDSVPGGPPVQQNPPDFMSQPEQPMETQMAQPQGAPQGGGHKEFLKGLLGNFLYSLGHGLQASAAASPGSAAGAGFGAALAAPFQRQQEERMMRLREKQAADDAARAQLYQQQAQYYPQVIQQKNDALQAAIKSKEDALKLAESKSFMELPDPNDSSKTMRVPVEMAKKYIDAQIAAAKNQSAEEMAQAKLNSNEKIAQAKKLVAEEKAKRIKNINDAISIINDKSSTDEEKEAAKGWIDKDVAVAGRKAEFWPGNSPMLTQAAGEPAGFVSRLTGKFRPASEEAQGAGYALGSTNMPQSAAEQISGTKTALDQYRELMPNLERYKGFGPVGGRITLAEIGKIGGAGASKEEIQLATELYNLTTSQAFANGGKQLTVTELERFQKQVPQLTDTLEQALIKTHEARKILRNSMANKIKSLPPRQRQLLDKSFLDEAGISYAKPGPNVSKVLGKTASTVKIKGPGGKTGTFKGTAEEAKAAGYEVIP